MSKQNCVKWDKKAKDDFVCKKMYMYIYFCSTTTFDVKMSKLGTAVILNMQWDFLSPVQV